MGSTQEIHQRVKNKFKKQTRNLDEVETGSKCLQAHLHTDTVLSLYQILFDISL